MAPGNQGHSSESLGRDVVWSAPSPRRRVVDWSTAGPGELVMLVVTTVATSFGVAVVAWGCTPMLESDEVHFSDPEGKGATVDAGGRSSPGGGRGNTAGAGLAASETGGAGAAGWNGGAHAGGNGGAAGLETAGSGTVVGGSGTAGVASCPAGFIDDGAENPTAECRPAIVELAAGESHTCARRVDGTVECWGSNSYGELGNGGTLRSEQPVPVLDLGGGARSIGLGDSFGCALLDNGRVSCWGDNEDGRVGNTYDECDFLCPTPTLVPDLARDEVQQLAVGAEHACVLLVDGSVVCWGNNGEGRLGLDPEIPWAPPTTVAGFDGVAVEALSVGAEHGCALLADRSVRCWGSNAMGQLGGGTESLVSADPVAVPGLEHVISIAVGGSHTCAVQDGGMVICWGANEWGQLGRGTRGESGTPVEVAELTGATTLALGDRHSCALLDSHEVVCWGMNYWGQVADGTFDSVLRPRVAVPIDRATAITAGSQHSCALLDGGSVQCWGNDGEGQLGDGFSGHSDVAVSVLDLNDAQEVAAGWRHTCARHSDGSVSCWGDNRYGQLGSSDVSMSTSPLPLTSLDHVESLAAGSAHNCALAEGGSLACWGQGQYGQLGIGSETVVNPEPVYPFKSGVVDVAAGDGHTCAVLDDGTAWCWGHYSNGMLGVEPSADGALSPALVPTLEETSFIEITAGIAHTCARTSESAVFCWGERFLGPSADDWERDHTAALVSPLGSVLEVAAGGYHSCALLGDEGVRCWGNNEGGQLGGNGFTSSPTPVAADEVEGTVALGCGDNFSCALLSDRTVQCWGNGDSRPQAVEGVVDAIALSVGVSHACALQVGGTVVCWGENDAGQLGNGGAGERPVPVAVVWP